MAHAFEVADSQSTLFDALLRASKRFGAGKPILEDQGIKVFTDERNAAALASAAGSDKTLVGYLKAHLKRIKTGDYFALLAYIQMDQEHETELSGLRIAVRDTKKVATCLGFGPRFLHSTGQA